MISIRHLTISDVALGMRLTEQAGWNQLEADWRRALALESEGCFVAEWDGKPVGTTTTCIFGPVAWIAMVLVDESVRGRGIGTALVKQALEFLDEAGVRSVRLDATPEGKPLYEKLGFAVQYQLARFEGTLPRRARSVGIRPVGRDEWTQLLQIDRDVTKTDRRRLLERMFAAEPDELFGATRASKLGSYVTVRRGSRALQVGPCIANDEAGRLLLGDVCSRHAGELAYLDIPTGNEAAMAFAQELGLTMQRHLTRMCRGPAVTERLSNLWTSSGPEKG